MGTLLVCGWLVFIGSVRANTYTEQPRLTVPDDPQQNLALGKPTSQIDTHDYVDNQGFWHNGSSHNAVDGNFQLDAKNRTCTRTGRHLLTWWMVDLQDYYVISDIVIFYDTPGYRVQNFSIEISMHWDEETKELIEPELCHSQLEELGLRQRTVLPCRSKTVGRFVRITKFRTGRFSMCQVEVYGSRTARSFSVRGRNGKRSKGRRLEEIQTSSPFECFARCARRLECYSFSLTEQGTKCDIMADDVSDIDDDDDKENATGWVTYLID